MDSYINHKGEEVPYQRCTELEFINYGSIPGYLVDCTDGNTYLLFAPDMSSLKHIHAYQKIIRMAKTYYSDHMYDPVRQCIRPAFCSELDEIGDYKVLHGPLSNLGKIFRLEK